MGRVINWPRTSVNDVILHHFLPRLSGTGLVNERGLRPLVLGNETKFHKRVRELRNTTAGRVDYG